MKRRLMSKSHDLSMRNENDNRNRIGPVLNYSNKKLPLCTFCITKYGNFRTKTLFSLGNFCDSDGDKNA